MYPERFWIVTKNYQLQEANHRTGLLAVEIDEQSVKIIIIDPFILFIDHQTYTFIQSCKRAETKFEPQIYFACPKGEARKAE